MPSAPMWRRSLGILENSEAAVAVAGQVYSSPVSGWVRTSTPQKVVAAGRGDLTDGVDVVRQVVVTAATGTRPRRLFPPTKASWKSSNG
jgi:hypothetical protein